MFVHCVTLLSRCAGAGCCLTMHACSHCARCLPYQCTRQIRFCPIVKVQMGPSAPVTAAVIKWASDQTAFDFEGGLHGGIKSYQASSCFRYTRTHTHTHTRTRTSTLTITTATLPPAHTSTPLPRPPPHHPHSSPNHHRPPTTRHHHHLVTHSLHPLHTPPIRTC
jgi:hypothetical protein